MRHQHTCYALLAFAIASAMGCKPTKNPIKPSVVFRSEDGTFQLSTTPDWTLGKLSTPQMAMKLVGPSTMGLNVIVTKSSTDLNEIELLREVIRAVGQQRKIVSSGEIQTSFVDGRQAYFSELVVEKDGVRVAMIITNVRNGDRRYAINFGGSEDRIDLVRRTNQATLQSWKFTTPSSKPTTNRKSS